MSVAYAVFGIVAAALLSPRVPYADAWRHSARLLTQPFPQSVVAIDNGHAEIFANLVRWIDLHWLAGDERWPIAVGLVLAVATFGVLAAIVRRARDASPTVRAAGLLVVSLAIFWFGNARALAHDNDALHVYSVLLCLAAMIALVLAGKSQRELSPRRLIAAILFCCAASFSFGSGVAAFVALFALLFVRGEGVRSNVGVALGLLGTLMLYWLLKDDSTTIAIKPVDQFVYAASELASPLLYLFWPFVDPAAAALLPAPLNTIAVAMANFWTLLFGDVQRSVLPQFSVGAVLICTLVAITFGARRHSTCRSDFTQLGLALAWFGVAVCILIGITRAEYFAANPAQLYVPRYLPWSTLAWGGMLIVLLGRLPALRSAVWATACVAVMALCAEGGMAMVAQHQQEAADDAALAALVGIWPDTDSAGENNRSEMQAGTAAMRQYRTGPFAWPEASLIGKPVPAGAMLMTIRSIEVKASDALANASGARIEATADSAHCAHDRLLVVAQGDVVGLVRQTKADRWRGAVAGSVDASELRLFEPACD